MNISNIYDISSLRHLSQLKIYTKSSVISCRKNIIFVKDLGMQTYFRYHTLFTCMCSRLQLLICKCIYICNLLHWCSYWKHSISWTKSLVLLKSHVTWSTRRGESFMFELCWQISLCCVPVVSGGWEGGVAWLGFPAWQDFSESESQTKSEPQNATVTNPFIHHRLMFREH